MTSKPLTREQLALLRLLPDSPSDGRMCKGPKQRVANNLVASGHAKCVGMNPHTARRYFVRTSKGRAAVDLAHAFFFPGGCEHVPRLREGWTQNVVMCRPAFRLHPRTKECAHATEPTLDATPLGIQVPHHWDEHDLRRIREDIFDEFARWSEEDGRGGPPTDTAALRELRKTLGIRE